MYVFLPYNKRKDLARVYVLRSTAAAASIIGYYSLNAYSLETQQLPEQIIQKLPRYELLPAILPGRLAIAQGYQGQKLGELLLVEALRRCLRLSGEVGAMAVLVKAKDERAALFYKRYGFRRFIAQPLRLFMTMGEISKLT
jgi:GNAT superfamily N-acetyltransferase